MLLGIKFILSLILILDTLINMFTMALFNNILHNDYVFIPLYIGMVGVIGWSWFSEGTKIFSNVVSSPVENVLPSPVSSWPWNPTLDRVTDASLIEQISTQQRLLRIQNQLDSDNKILEALRETRESATSILNKLEELKRVQEGAQQIQSIADANLMIPQTPVTIDPGVASFVAQEAISIAKAAESIQDVAGFWGI